MLSLKHIIKYRLRKYPRSIEYVRKLLGKKTGLTVIQGIVKKGDTVFDIGANTGQYTLPLSHMIGKNGVIHIFEPIARSFKILKQQIDYESPDAKYFLNNCALSDNEGYVDMIIPNEDYTQASMISHKEASWSSKQNVAIERCRVITLDSYISNKVRNINFLKCDVEGAELKVMKGAKNILNSHFPPIIMVECYEKWTLDFGYSPQDLFKFLEDQAGYLIYFISNAGFKQVSSKDRVVPGIFWEWLDFLCLAPDFHLRYMKKLNLLK